MNCIYSNFCKVYVCDLLLKVEGSLFCCRLRVLMSLIARAHILYRQRLWYSNTSHSRYSTTLYTLFSTYCMYV